MKILLIGGTGIIGSAIATLLKEDHEVITVGRTNGDYQVDIMNSQSLEELFRKVGPVDGIITTFGGAIMEPYYEQKDEDVALAINSKLKAQIDVIRLGVHSVKDNGFIIATSGASGELLMPNSSLLTTANAGIEGYVKSTAVEPLRGIRINAVSPSVVKESIELLKLNFPGGISAADTAKVYKMVMESDQNGKIAKVHEYLRK